MAEPAHTPMADPAADRPLLLDRPKAAALLSISPRLLWSLTNSGEIPHIKLGRRVLYPLARLEEWIASRSEGGA